jgi:virginiamycin B lyase
LVALVGLLGVLVLPAAAPAVTEFPVPTPVSQPAGITPGSDGAVWFTEENGNKIGRITVGGNITEYQIPTPSSVPSEITTGPDGALWFTEFAANPPQIGRFTIDGGFNEYPLPLGSGPDGITTGPDGNLWFTENGSASIGRIPSSGAPIDHYPLPTGFRPGDITPGPDGRLWFTESEAHKIGAITRGGNITEYDLPVGSDPSGIAASGATLWFTMHGVDRIGSINPLAPTSIAEFGPTGSGPSGIALGSDGVLWFTETGANKIGRMTTTGRITEFSIPTAASQPGDIVAGPDGALWFTEFTGNNIGRIEVGGSGFVAPPPPQLQPASPKSAPRRRACRVPKVRGLTVRKAIKKLRRAGCRYRIRGKGRVVSTRPRAGKRTRATVQVRAKRKRR